jgi:hypothetical protein
MTFSRQFKALAKISAFFATTWATVGAVIGAIWGPSAIGGTVVAAAANFAMMYGLVGGIAGATTALLVARVESGRNIGDVPTWRVATWGVFGGSAPAVLFGVLGLLAGAPIAAVLPLVGLSVLSGTLGGAVAAASSTAAKAVQLPQPASQPGLPGGTSQ